MTTASSLPATIQLHLLSFDAPGAIVTNWLGTSLSNWQDHVGLWLLLEQMHRFDLEGPDVSKIQPLITADALDTYGLRGRLFWETGQIEWRRLSSDRLRVVVMAEGSMPLATPDSIQPIADILTLEPHDSRLILWGTSRSSKDGGKFRELRVAGSNPIDYPDVLQQSAAGMRGTLYPVLPFRTYADDEGIERFRRFLPPTVCDKKVLLQPSSTDVQQENDVDQDVDQEEAQNG